MCLIVFAFLSHVSAFENVCSMDNNRDGQTNPDCNLVGVCKYDKLFDETRCKCCEPNDCGRNCDPDNPTSDCFQFANSGTCTRVNDYLFTNIGFRALDRNPSQESDLTCSTIPKDRKLNRQFGNLSLSMFEVVNAVAKKRGWIGTLKEVASCDTCSVDYPCVVGISDGVTADTGITFAFQVDFNEYYDSGCYFESIFDDELTDAECDANYDYGLTAFKTWLIVGESTSFVQDLNSQIEETLGWTNTYILAMGDHPQMRSDYELELTLTPTRAPTMPTLSPTLAPTAVPTLAPTGAPTQAPTGVPTQTPTQTPTGTPTQTPTGTPTQTPTGTPTQTPTGTPTQTPTVTPTQTPTVEGCRPYANSISDIKYIGSGENCRAGLNMSYPGGLSCDSPYIVCLPQENTPVQEYSTTHRYSLDECKQECANDQRCLGIEFVPDNDDSRVGDCNLIDDIPLEITPSEISKALCYEKKDDCYPYFEADDLDATMLNCYCPNNRKGFYTKKVKRTVENTRFCGDDTDIEMSIKKAQANRMFHLCENWCLFDTENPTQEYWFWDPWKTCWREQEDTSTYCTQAIEDPLTIEMQFLINRREHFCPLN